MLLLQLVPFNKVKLLKGVQEKDVTRGQLALFKDMLKTLTSSIKEEAGLWDMATMALVTSCWTYSKACSWHVLMHKLKHLKAALRHTVSTPQ
ncbi:hypothetical protein AALO_G00058210 [Alosa alosa]|uniref:Uncharacterized protein n=1 Tax=Alosa alosa TaxID=278164 RepID=A0AAV6H5R8_9TELE|nr:hypothetical protein AALO_G00058210 [Alosa alosa]